MRPLSLSEDGKNKPYSPSTALTGTHKLSNLMNPVSGFYSSPSFGPQHSLTNPSAFSLTAANGSQSTATTPMGGQTEGSQNSSPAKEENAETVGSLKIRISELELVNDLYKSRIQELESLEQASRKREDDLVRRLEHSLTENVRKKVKLENETGEDRYA